MSKPKKLIPKADITRSSAAEYLTFVAATGDQTEAIEVRYHDENIWLTQRMMAELYGVSVPAINQHSRRLIDDGELEPAASIKKYLIVQQEGERQVSRRVGWRTMRGFST
jgi:hypothetical protein